MHRTLHMRRPPAKVKTSESFNLEEGESLMLMTPGTTASQLSPVVVDRKGRPYPETPHVLHRITTSSTAGSDMDDVKLSRQNSDEDESGLFDDDSQSSESADDNHVTVVRGVSSRRGMRGSGS